MIKDKIENYKLYEGINSKIAKAFNYINTTNLMEIPLGKYEIDGDVVFAIVNEYETVPIAKGFYEGHQKYIDLQYVISGYEYVGIATLNNQKPTEIHEEEDYDVYDLKSDLIKFEAGSFMLFFPDDLHMPEVHINHPSTIKKVVVKIKI